ncbi:hypothetical protein D8674_001784 [Pyrus ussuriensis x Pyrus communis]|uniref:RNase H type-1 domain-containing protein n=1 Tax=Pyrus ussuriensis x Pyrus communis TaxID=2448454 RepID=A0A5N5FKK2_9ROSA|nr:hypothetical protein D8674_001784 [Pyrus ussuriensis x Pyrus communis]
MKHNAYKGRWTWELSGPTTTCIFGTCHFMPTKCLIFSDIFSPLQAEVVAVQVDLIWAFERGFTNLLCEMIADIKAIVSTVTEVSFTHTRRQWRQANGVAHRLARTGLSVDQFRE